jgi:hypothetical protein
MNAWVGVDLDGTLAQYEGWVSPTHIGEPIPLMVERVKHWLAEGKEVRIFTARVYYDTNTDKKEFLNVCIAIQQWCKWHIGEVLPITCRKDYGMVELWDDRAVQVIPNTGKRVDGNL